MATSHKVVVIPPRQKEASPFAIPQKKKVAAYCRVSTDDEEQLSSYEAQKTYYTGKILSNPEWALAGIFADKGITGTSAKKRPEFLKMIRQCEKNKIDIVLVKSISRFARNTVDCLNYIRLLKEHNIAVIFEKENINTLETSSEVFIALHGAFAQGESESISENVRWGKRQAMREGKTNFQFKWLYGYRRGEDGEPVIEPEEAEIVRQMYQDYLSGDSLRMISEKLAQRGIPSRAQKGWCTSAIRSILTNEKYCGDILLQKTYVVDCISKKAVKNNGELPKYYVPDHHDAIVDRKTYDAVQAEMARRSAGRSPSKKQSPTGMTSYASKYALSERLVCGECGTLFRRCTWAKRGKKKVVWRCTNRLDYGTRHCHNSPSIPEEPLQQAIIAALNRAMKEKAALVREIAGAMELELVPTDGEELSLADIVRRLEEIGPETMRIVASAAANGGQSEEETQLLKALVDEAADLRGRKARLLEMQSANKAASQRIERVITALEDAPCEITAWDESMIRQLVGQVKVLNATTIEVWLKSGAKIEQTL